MRIQSLKPEVKKTESMAKTAEIAGVMKIPSSGSEQLLRLPNFQFSLPMVDLSGKGETPQLCVWFGRGRAFSGCGSGSFSLSP